MAKSKNWVTNYVQSFFQVYLPEERGLSQHTVKSYRDTLKLFLSHLAEKNRGRIESVTPEDLTAQNVLRFLGAIEKSRGNSIRTRNQRLAVLKTFFSYLLTQDPSRANQFEKVSHITMKRMPYRPIEYLTEEELQAMLDSIDRSTKQGTRDYAILIALYNTGARVQELCDLRLKDLRLESPYMATLTGKGKKVRHVPLWESTVKAIGDYLKSVDEKTDDDFIFMGKRNEPLSRFGIRYLVNEQAKRATSTCRSLKGKKMGPHVLRHTTAMHLLQSGVDINVIKAWLGHVDLNTTHGYVEIDMKMKQEALGKAKKPKAAKEIREMLSREKDIVKWLESL